jgi:hypothetical protein
MRWRITAKNQAFWNSYKVPFSAVFRNTLGKYNIHKNSQLGIQINDTYSDTTNPIFETLHEYKCTPLSDNRVKKGGGGVHLLTIRAVGCILDTPSQTATSFDMQALHNPASTDMQVYKQKNTSINTETFHMGLQNTELSSMGNRSVRETVSTRTQTKPPQV